jgi:hypothetical protein
VETIFASACDLSHTFFFNSIDPPSVFLLSEFTLSI